LRHFRAIAPVLLKKSVQPPQKPFSTASAINGHALRSIDANVYSITASTHDPEEGAPESDLGWRFPRLTSGALYS
ncbi:MAG: hypothetical protein WBD83_26840, partial [Xanthobacteraceae bacterium]